MKYQVFQDGKPADCHNFDVHESWSKSTYNTFDDAVAYAHRWAYPSEDSSYHKMEIDTPIDMSMCEFPVMMEIRKCYFVGN